MPARFQAALRPRFPAGQIDPTEHQRLINFVIREPVTFSIFRVFRTPYQMCLYPSAKPSS